MSRRPSRALDVPLLDLRFAAPKEARPAAVAAEEARRLAIAKENQAHRRAGLRTARSAEERTRRIEAWRAADATLYKFDPADQEVDLYAVQEPFQYVQVLRNRRTHQMTYHLIEPMMSDKERALYDFVRETIIDSLALHPAELETTELRRFVEERFDEVVHDYSIKFRRVSRDKPATTRARMLYFVQRDFLGEGVIDAMMHDPRIEDISCDGPHQPLFVYHRQHESMTSTVRFRGHAELDSFVIRMAQRAGKHISIAEPMLDATFPDGSRIQATLAKEVSTFGSTFTIRKFKEVPFTPIDLIQRGTADSALVAYLWLIVQHQRSLLVAGGTASGKTSTLNATMLFIPPANKVVTIEDTREINIPQPNWIAGLTRDGFGPRDEKGRQAGEIGMFQLLRNALRQRPEYIIVGEVRGEEAFAMFQAMATGHAAYGTLHADSVDAVIHRLESAPISIPRSLLEALDVVVIQQQTRVKGRRVRRIRSIAEIVGLDSHTQEILTSEVFRWDAVTDAMQFTGVSYVLDGIAEAIGVPPHEMRRELEDRTRVIEYFTRQRRMDYNAIAKAVGAYYRNKEAFLERVREDRPWQ